MQKETQKDAIHLFKKLNLANKKSCDKSVATVIMISKMKGYGFGRRWGWTSRTKVKPTCAPEQLPICAPALHHSSSEKEGQQRRNFMTATRGTPTQDEEGGAILLGRLGPGGRIAQAGDPCTALN